MSPPHFLHFIGTTPFLQVYTALFLTIVQLYPGAN